MYAYTEYNRRKIIKNENYASVILRVRSIKLRGKIVHIPLIISNLVQGPHISCLAFSYHFGGG